MRYCAILRDRHLSGATFLRYCAICAGFRELVARICDIVRLFSEKSQHFAILCNLKMIYVTLCYELYNIPCLNHTISQIRATNSRNPAQIAHTVSSRSFSVIFQHVRPRPVPHDATACPGLTCWPANTHRHPAVRQGHGPSPHSFAALYTPTHAKATVHASAPDRARASA